MKNPSKIATVIKTICAVLVFGAGLVFFLYPAISSVVNERTQVKVISNYEQAIAALSEEEHARSLEQAKLYNQALEGNQDSISDPFDSSAIRGEAEANEVVSVLTAGEVMGYIQIPRIGIKSPIYQGTAEVSLQNGIGWLEGTSLPVGGESTHTVLTGHRGLPTAKLFTDLEKIERNDEFYIKNSSEILAYRVFEIEVIDPGDVDALTIVTGKDRATLLTCHPYMVNSHRLLVKGERIPYIGQLDELADSDDLFANLSAAQRDLLTSGLASLLFVGIAVGLVLLMRHRRKKREEG